MIITKYFFTFALCLFLTACFDFVYAKDNYRTEISANYFHSEDGSKTTLHDIDARIYFLQVNTFSHPLAEAAFLERIGSVSFLVGKRKLESNSLLLNIEADGPTYTSVVTYAKPDIPLTLQATYTMSDLEFESPLDGDFKLDTYGLGIGYFFARNLFGGITFVHSKSNMEISLFSLSVDETSNTDEYEIFAKYVKERSDGTAYNIESNIGIQQFDNSADDGSNTFVEISGDYYFNQRISLGGGIGVNTGDDKYGEGKTFAIDFNVFLSPRSLVNVSFESFLADNDEGEDEESYDIRLAMRF